LLFENFENLGRVSDSLLVSSMIYASNLGATQQQFRLHAQSSHIHAHNTTSSSSRSLTRPVQQQWWSWWSSSGPPSPHIVSARYTTKHASVVSTCFVHQNKQLTN